MFSLSLFAGFSGEGPEPHGAQPHSGLHRLQVDLTGQEAGGRHMLFVGGRAALLSVMEISGGAAEKRIYKVSRGKFQVYVCEVMHKLQLRVPGGEHTQHSLNPFQTANISPNLCV